MQEPGREVIIGILGQWASGKSTAASTIVEYLGGEGEVVFLNDQHIFAAQVLSYILELEPPKIVLSTEVDGRQRVDGEIATIWLNSGEDLSAATPTALSFCVSDQTIPIWLNNARIELAHQIRERSAERKPIVIEAGFGEYPADHTLTDLFLRLEEAQVELKRLKWIIVEAGYDKRVERNEKRQFGVPGEIFARIAAAGGDLDPASQKRLEQQGVNILRVSNEHDDVDKFKADSIAAFESMLWGTFLLYTLEGHCLGNSWKVVTQREVSNICKMITTLNGSWTVHCSIYSWNYVGKIFLQEIWG